MKTDTTTTEHLGWSWDNFRNCWDKGDDRIYPVNGSFVIASCGTWLPGSFATFEAAEQGLSDAG